ncbi:MAG: hypothetical protein ACI9VX_001454 [Dinoroseobacter sp.]|jgi:hypothetical protein
MPLWRNLIPVVLLAACTEQGPDIEGAPERVYTYEGISTRLLADDLVNFHVEMAGDPTRDDLALYGRCAAAQYALIRGYGFARHVRTTAYKEGGLWRGDAVYTISPALPRGLQALDAEVVVADCAENKIPTV